jgi:hypothetical protein
VGSSSFKHYASPTTSAMTIAYDARAINSSRMGDHFYAERAPVGTWRRRGERAPDGRARLAGNGRGARTRDLVYARLVRGVLDELERLNPIEDER